MHTGILRGRPQYVCQNMHLRFDPGFLHGFPLPSTPFHIPKRPDSKQHQRDVLFWINLILVQIQNEGQMDERSYESIHLGYDCQ